jgi:abortive infection bacteriophage resistance protein
MLQQRGMSIPDLTETERFLSNVNYYRFRPYLEPFVDQATNCRLRPFYVGTAFDTVVERYIFDMRLRTLLLQAFNYIEISLRTQWTYHLSYSHGGGEYAHLDPSLFSGEKYIEHLAKLKEDYEDRGRNLHPYDFNNCPIWAISEVMSFGQISRWYNSTIPTVRQLVSDHYQLHQRILRSLLRHLGTVRNFCAHHELLWDRGFITKFSLPKQMGGFLSPRTFFNESQHGKLYNTLVMIAYLTTVITGNKDWTRDLLGLMDQHPNIPQDRMGFADDWQKLDIWQG